MADGGTAAGRDGRDAAAVQVQEELEELVRRPPVLLAQAALVLCRVLHQVCDVATRVARRAAQRTHVHAEVYGGCWYGGAGHSSKFIKKIVYINKLEELAQHVRLEQLDIPDEVWKADQAIKPSKAPAAAPKSREDAGPLNGPGEFGRSLDVRTADRRRGVHEGWFV